MADRDEMDGQQAGARRVDLSARDRAWTLEIIRRRLPDAVIWVYGSRVTGNARRYSDLDLLLDNGGQPIPGAVMGHLDADFDESSLPIIVDLHDMAATDADFLKRIAGDLAALD